MPFDVLWFSHASQPEANKAVGDYISSGIWGRERDFPLSTTMAVFDQGQLIAGFVFYDYDADAGVMQISGASSTPRWLTKRTLFALFDYPFNKAGCQTVVMRVDPANTRLARILTSYGFQRFDLPRLRGRDKDEALYILHDDVWRNNGFHNNG